MLDGNAKEAIAFYEKALAAKVISVQTYSEMSPADHPVPDGARDRIAHALLKAGATELMFSDTFPGMPHQTGNHVQITIVSNHADSSKQLFDALAEGGRASLPLQETAWSPAFGQLTDKFGVTWSITTEV